MPQRDGTGPNGQGMMTGRGRGHCQPGGTGRRDFRQEHGMGMSCGHGCRRGHGRGAYQANRVEENPMTQSTPD